MFNRKSKFILTLSAVLMAGGVLSACGNNNNENAASSGTNASAGAKEAPVELKIFSWFMEGVDDPGSPILQAVQEKLNIKIKPMAASWNDWEEKLNVTIASGDMPDIFLSYGVERPSQYLQWIKEGMLLPISDYADQYPNIQQQLTKFDVLAKVTGDKHYGLPVSLTSNDVQTLVDGANIMVRKDWLDNLGLQIPTTIDEFYEVAKAFTFNDPDGNGKNDTYGFSSSSGGFYWSYPIYNAFDASFDRWKKIDGQWQPEIISDEMKNAVTFLNKMYNEKILDPEFMLLTDEQWQEKFVTGKVGFFVNNMASAYPDLHEKFTQLYPDKDPETMMTWVGTLKGVNGQQRWDGTNNFWTQTSINASISEEKQKKALELLDYLLSDEGQKLMLNGIEGVHYKQEGDKIVSLVTSEEKSDEKAFNLQSLVTYNNDYLPEDKPHRDVIMAMNKSVNDHAYPNDLAFLTIPEDVLDPSIPGQVINIFVEDVVKLIANSKDVEADFAKYKERYLSAGGDKYIEATNQVAAAEGR